MNILQKLIPLKREFYNRNTIKVAKDLLGKVIVRNTNKDHVLGRIVEVEAYKSGEYDKASHARSRCTDRNKVMFGKNGFSYVYLAYGIYSMFNVVAKNNTEDAGAVLIRGLEPIKGIECMKRNRTAKTDKELTNGPGKLTKALFIDKKCNNIDLTKKGELYITNFEKRKEQVISSSRIGISLDIEKQWRFYLEDNNFVSRYSFNKNNT